MPGMKTSILKAARSSSENLKAMIDPLKTKPEFVGAMQIALVLGGAGILAGAGQEMALTSALVIVLAGAAHLASGSLLKSVPSLSWVGKIIIDRFENTHSNWIEKPLRSFTEFVAWLYVIFVVQASGECIQLSVAIGVLCGLPIVLLGELLGSCFERLQAALVHWNGSGQHMVTRVFQPGFVWLAYFGGVFLAHILTQGKQQDTRRAVVLSVLTGAAFVTAGQLLIAWRPTRTVCRIMQGRVLNTRRNWRIAPVRSAVETAAFLGSMCGCYAMLGDPLLSIGLSTCAGIIICLACEHTMGPGTEEAINASALAEYPLLLPLATVDLTLIVMYAIFSNAQSVQFAVALSVMSSVVVCAIGRLCLLFPCTVVMGRIIDGRIRNTSQNWANHPLRSGYEFLFWQVCVFAAYSFHGSVIPALRLGTALGGCNILVTNILYPVEDSSMQHSPRIAPKTPPQAPKAATVGSSPSEEIHVNQRIVRCVDKSAPMKIGVDGAWYDIENFAKHHPGGDVIYEFLGRDATSQFYAFHSPSVLKRFKSVGTYDMGGTETGQNPAEMAFLEMVKRLDREGYFKSENAYYLKKSAVCASIMACVVVGAVMGYVLVPGALLGLFWMQSGFMTHDLMHNQIFKKRRVDQAHGWFWGNVCLGASGVWWRDEHFEHHVFTNTFLRGTGATDPQQHEAPLWAQDEALKETTNPWLLRIQHFTFLPLLIVGGRFGLIIASYSMQRGLWEHFGCLLHWVYVTLLLRVVWLQHAWMGVLGFYMAGACVQGILGVQLCISHYDKAFIEKEDAKNGKAGWLRRQVYVSKDISCPWWVDWFHGGLNLHRVHHLMPRLSRCRYREVTKQLDQLLDKHHIKSDVEPFFTAVSSTLSHMRKQALLVTMAELLGG